MSRGKDFVLAGNRSQEYVKLKLTPKQLQQVALRLTIAPLTETQKSQMTGALTERRHKSVGKLRKTPVRKRSKLATAIQHFGPEPGKKRVPMPNWKFLEDTSQTAQKTPKFKSKKELALTDRTLTSQQETETPLLTETTMDSPLRRCTVQKEPLQRSQLHTDLEELDHRILKEIEFHDSQNAAPLEHPPPLLLPADLLTSYQQALYDIQRMRRELENLKTREASIVELNSQLRDTISLQQRRNQFLKTSQK